MAGESLGCRRSHAGDGATHPSALVRQQQPVVGASHRVLVVDLPSPERGPIREVTFVVNEVIDRDVWNQFRRQTSAVAPDELPVLLHGIALSAGGAVEVHTR